MKTFLREVLGTLLLAIAIFFLIQATVQSSVVVGCSMEPSLYNGQRLLISKIAYNSNLPQRGDIVIFDVPDLDKDIIHRIVGMPGELVEMRAGDIYIDGLKLEESYTQGNSITRAAELVPENHYYIVGDNRATSRIDTVPLSDIVGKAWLSIWPIAEWGLAPNYSLP